MQDYGLVSIITPSYNCSAFIAETIDSILSQTYTDWELLITDDCSTDNSCEVINDYVEKDARIRLMKLSKNSGAGSARNNSIKVAKGRFIAFCDSDDLWMPDKLEKQLQFMIERRCALTYSSYITCDENGAQNGYVKCLMKLNYAKILRDNGIGCLTAIYDAELIGKHYMPSIRKRQDWCLWISIIKEVGTAYGLQEPLAIYRLRTGSISSNKLEMLRYNFNVYHKVIHYPKWWALIVLMCYFMPYYFYKKLKNKMAYCS
jgi:glycosyltransferase involved in cell wall biosynthesis